MEQLSLTEFKASAIAYTKGLKKGANTATVIALHGDLGAGKTTFVQQVAETLAVKGDVISPTFVIQKQYPLTGQLYSQLVHIDAYRLERASELEVLGWAELQKKPENLILIEWPENVESVLPLDTQHIYFSYNDENSRTISYGKEN